MATLAADLGVMRTAPSSGMTGDEPFPTDLLGHVWHTTSLRLYDLILQSGSILPNPDLPDSERWKTSRGPEYYPYVRVLGGVSLFDFRGFEPIMYSDRYPMSSWREFVPYRRSQGGAVWMQIDTDSLGSAFLDGQALKARQIQDKAYQHTLMPAIEAAHVGPLPLSAVRRVFQVGPGTSGFVELPHPCKAA